MSTVCRICKAESSYHYSFLCLFEMKPSTQTPTYSSQLNMYFYRCFTMLFQSFGRPPGNAGFAYHIILVTICNIQFINTMLMLFINLMGSKLKHLQERVTTEDEACTPYVVNSNTTKVCACLPPSGLCLRSIRRTTTSSAVTLHSRSYESIIRSATTNNNNNKKIEIKIS